MPLHPVVSLLVDALLYPLSSPHEYGQCTWSTDSDISVTDTSVRLPIAGNKYHTRTMCINCAGLLL